MKHIKYLVIALFILSACKKEKHAAQEPDPIVGQWDWVRSTSWGVIISPQMLDKTWTLKFNADSTVSQTGTLAPVVDGVYRQRGDSLFVTYSNNDVAKFSYRYITSDSLELDAGSVVDGSVHVFARK